ncbi:DUF1453 domain-containing protein [Actinomadura rayongensis]|uniref:DUF1453 domain-containing protein n=1 Tax=Actinomadura rayongensis TaxID=1429076 RepID=A0A6I4WBT2_9ACTN|nr:DUF1453 domain-containing protein [Actinomadura rayongensis]MXQ66563.1 DUF1453 domain-containing protein [Actinomadura rayongensis]
MSTAAEIVLVVIALGYVLSRQLTARPLEEKSSFRVPLILAAVGLFSGGLVDRDHIAVSVVLLVAGVVVALGSGVVRALTVRVWRDQDGVLWRGGTPWTLAAWVGSVLLRVGLVVVGHLTGAASEGSGLLLFLGLTLLVQNALVVYRARTLTVPAPAAKGVAV